MQTHKCCNISPHVRSSRRSLDCGFLFSDFGFHPLDSGFHFLDSGFHLLDSRFHSLDSRSHSLDSGSHSLDSGFHSLDSGSHSLDSGFHSLDSGSHSLDSGFHFLDSGFHLLDSRSHSLDSRSHSLDSRSHSLDSGFHFLDSGFHSLDLDSKLANVVFRIISSGTKYYNIITLIIIYVFVLVYSEMWSSNSSSRACLHQIIFPINQRAMFWESFSCLTHLSPSGLLVIVQIWIILNCSNFIPNCHLNNNHNYIEKIPVTYR